MPSKENSETSSSDGATGVLKQVAEGLRREPAYLLLLGVILIHVCFGSGAKLVGVVKGDGEPRFQDWIGLLSSLIATIVIVFLVQRRGKASKKELVIEQLNYVKVISLRKREDGASPGYERLVERIRKKVSVFDEEVHFTLTSSSHKSIKHQWDMRSSGVVDTRTVFPWVPELQFPDKGMAENESFISQYVSVASNTCLSVCHVFNGLQPGKEDLATKALCDLEHIRLVVDFSSIPEAKQLITPVEAWVCTGGEETKVNRIKECQPGMFTVARDDFKQGQVLRMNFKIEWDKMKVERDGVSI